MLLALTLPQAIILGPSSTSSPTPRQNLPQRSSLAARNLLKFAAAWRIYWGFAFLAG
jgi:hypothetical protein